MMMMRTATLLTLKTGWLKSNFQHKKEFKEKERDLFISDLAVRCVVTALTDGR